MDSGISRRSNLEFNNVEQNEEENFSNFGINQNVGYPNDQNDDINIANISQIDNPITNENQNKKDKENNITKAKTKTKNISNILTKSKTLPTRKEITNIMCDKTSLLDLFNENKTFKQIVDEKEQELKNEYNNNRIIKINDNEIEEQENKIIKKDDVNKNEMEKENKNELKENINNDNKDSSPAEEKDYDIFELDEEDEEIKKERELIIEKILKRTDELVYIPNFNILDDSKFKEFLNKDDDFGEEEKK